MSIPAKELTIPFDNLVIGGVPLLTGFHRRRTS